jgi:hypothetical protein
MDAAKEIRDTMPHPEVPSVGLMKMNLNVTETPFDSDVRGHIDTSDGEILIEDGHVEDPDLTVTIEYETARAIFVNLDFTTAMQSFMAGKIQVQGDITKLLAMQTPGAEPDPQAVAIAEAVRAITAD